MWQNGAITDLNSLLPANSGWVLEEADGIDANGDIFGIGTLNGVGAEFLLTPEGSSATASLSISASAPNLTITGSASRRPNFQAARPSGSSWRPNCRNRREAARSMCSMNRPPACIPPTSNGW